jgi:hypothetical protein
MTEVKLKTFALAFTATAFMAGAALADMQPIPNPPEKAKMMHHKKKMMKAKPAADAMPAKSADAAMPAKPAMPAKK